MTGYLDCLRKIWRLRSDFVRMLDVWRAFGGFKASTGTILNFLGDYSLLMVEYATWTANTFDDKLAEMTRYVLIDHRDTLEMLIERIRSGKTPSTVELLAVTQLVCATKDEYSDPMTVLFIISILYRTLMYLNTKTNTIPAPDDDNTKPDVEPVKQPVRNFIRKLFNKPLLA